MEIIDSSLGEHSNLCYLWGIRPATVPQEGGVQMGFNEEYINDMK